MTTAVRSQSDGGGDDGEAAANAGGINRGRPFAVVRRGAAGSALPLLPLLLLLLLELDAPAL